MNSIYHSYAIIKPIWKGGAFLKKYAKLLLFLFVALGLAVLDLKFGWSRRFANPAEWLFLRQAVERNFALALGLYVVLTALASTLLALPGVIFALTAGALFGPWWGTAACTVAATLGASLSFWAGRTFLKETVKPWLEKNALLRRVLFEDADRTDFYLLALTRLVPIFPFNLQNFAYGVTDIGFWPYFFYTLLFILPDSAIYVTAAAGLTDPTMRRACLITAGLLFVALFLVSLFLKRRVTAPKKKECPLDE